MSSRWRKKEQFKIESNTNSTMNSKETFSNIPMLDILKNIPDENKNIMTNLANEKKVEGFDGGGGSFEWQGMDYYHHHNVFKLYDYSKIKEYIAKIMGYISYPLINFDSMLEQYIYDILSTCFLIEIDNCDDKQRSTKNKYKQAADKMFFWIDTKKHDKEDSEGFSLKEQPKFVKTINSFQINHPNFIKNTTIKNQVGIFYMNRLNNHETKLHRRLRDDELFEFNNKIDNLLNDPNIQKQILKLNVVKYDDDEIQPNSEYTESGYKKYYDSFARFKIENTTTIEYHKLNEGYFPINANFDDALTYANNMLIQLTPQKLKEHYTEQNVSNNTFSTVNAGPPTVINSTIDANYGFSVNITTGAEIKTMQEYLKYVIKYFSLILFEKKYLSNESYVNDIGFQEIEARVGTIYTNCLNRLEFAHYNTYGVYLDEYNIAIFNHIFYILIKQNKESTNPYNAITNKYVNIVDSSATDNKIFAKDIFKRFIVANNKLYSLLQSDSIDNLIIPVVELNPFIDMNVPSDAQYLQDYIVNETSKSEEMEKYYIPMSECEWHKQKDRKNAHKDLSNFAKIIKNEIYRILMIPVLLYLVYNIYYMFFFIDYVDDPQIVNGVPSVKDCKYPIFPDWENQFHYHEKHKTDFLFEYIFKPTKVIYTWLNMIKTFIRTFPVIGLIASQNKAASIRIPPYIYFFATIILFYHVLGKYGNGFLNFYISFFKTLSVPFVKIIKDPKRDIIKLLQLEGKIEGTWLGYSEIGIIITFLFMALSFIKDNTGWDAINMIANLLCGIPEPEDKKKTWIEWFSSTPIIIITILKAIIWILYWLFKFYISLAMVPIANIIAIIYVAYTTIFAMKNYSSKKDLINNIIYTELYDIPEDSNGPMYLLTRVYKTICWLLMVFIMEIISIYVLLTGLKNITSNITNSGDGNYAEAIKIVLTPIYVALMVLIGIWCMYKFKFKIPVMSLSYNKKHIVDNAKDKRVDAKQCALHTDKNDPLNFMDTFSIKCILGTLLGSDYINNLIIEKEMNNKKNEQTKESKYMNDLFDLLARKGNDHMNKMNDSITNLSNNTKLKTDISTGMTNLSTNLKEYKTKFSNEAKIIKEDIRKQAGEIVNGIGKKASGIFTSNTKKMVGNDST